MKQFLKLHKAKTLLIALIIVGGFLRFYNLDWGSPFYFHPDERNIASSIAQLSFPTQMNPNFFAYGSFPIYSIYFISVVLNTFLNFSREAGSSFAGQLSIFNFYVSFEQAILTSRFLSALLGTMLIPLLYVIGNKLKGKSVGLLAAFLATFSVGFIQFAHFGTFEIWLTFLSVLLFYVCLEIIEKEKLKYIIATGILLGLLASTKISNLTIAPLPLIALLLYYFNKKHFFNHQYTIVLLSIKKFLLSTFILTFFSLLIFIMISPFALIDNPSFISSIRYESDVAFGRLPVFYTGGFFNTIPIIYQFTKIYPFLLNPLIAFMLIPSLIYITYTAIKRKILAYYFLFTIFYLLFLPQTFLFAKWTRYMVPTLPFIYLIIAIAIYDLFINLKTKAFANVFKCLLITIFLINIFWGAAYFFTVYTKTDTRIAASLWAKDNISANATILSEVYDLGIMPFNRYFPNIELFNSYDLDTDLSLTSHFSLLTSNSDYIILPSQRIMKNRLENQKKFPKGHTFYTSLFNDSFGYKKIYETPCDLFCKITYINGPIFALEETASVFDRPTILIFKKR